MSTLYMIKPGKGSPQLDRMINSAYHLTENVIIVNNKNNIPCLKNKRIIFAIELNDLGVNSEIYSFLSVLYGRGKDALSGSVAGIMVHSPNELFTKSVTKNIIFITNQMGCLFIGHPLIEATGSLNNFLTWKKQFNKTLEEICDMLCLQLMERILNYKPMSKTNPKILALHSSSRRTSNTLLLWDMVKSHLKNFSIKELHVENGTVQDCKGCPYKTCMHYSKQSSCFYGGFMVEEVFPAIEEADVIVWICPNYNDSISANLMAVINRLTSLYRKTKLYDKTFFSIVVSGNSGSDSVAKQLIDALNVNKGLYLPPYFTIMATANDPFSILEVEDIKNKAKHFAHDIINVLSK